MNNVSKLVFCELQCVRSNLNDSLRKRPVNFLQHCTPLTRSPTCQFSNNDGRKPTAAESQRRRQRRKRRPGRSGCGRIRMSLKGLQPALKHCISHHLPREITHGKALHVTVKCDIRVDVDTYGQSSKGKLPPRPGNVAHFVNLRPNLRARWLVGGAAIKG